VDTDQKSGTAVFRRRGIALITGGLALMLSVACSREPKDTASGTTIDIRPKPAETTVSNPTTLRVTLRVAGDTVEIVAAEPKRGNASHHDEAREIEEVVAGHLRLLRYRVLDASGAVLSSGQFTVPSVAVAEYEDPNTDDRIIREEQTLSSVAVTVSIPYSAAMRAIEIEELTPVANVPPDQWAAEPATRVQIPAGVVP
jgi:hypothetical protein